jgi:hypothetical protein
MFCRGGIVSWLIHCLSSSKLCGCEDFLGEISLLSRDEKLTGLALDKYGALLSSGS